MPGWVKVGVLVLVAAIVAGGGVAYVMLRSTSTPVEVEDAVDRYRDEAADGSASDETPGASVPAEGVYVYTTDASERVDVLTGADHSYPEQTTMTVRHTDCGFRLRWAPIVEHWEEDELCMTDAGLERRSHFVHHEFFGMTDDREYECEPGYLLLPVEPEIGASWPTSCATATSTVTGTGQVVGFETRTIAGRDIETIHIRLDERNAGVDEGPSTTDYWLRVTDGLLVERSSTAETVTDSPVGTAVFTGRYSLLLVSPTPQT